MVRVSFSQAAPWVVMGLLAATCATHAGAAGDPAFGGAEISPKETVFRKALTEATSPTADLTVSARTAATGVWTILSVEHGPPPHGTAPAAWVRVAQGDARTVHISQWAIAEGCPVFSMVLSSAATLRAPAIHIPGADPALPPTAPKAPPSPHDVLYDVWASSLRYGGIPDAVSGSLHFTGYVNSPPDRWLDNALTRLEPCWRSEETGGALSSTPVLR
ncbi:MAG: hypothetical protein WCI21_02420 [Alphaproteobacteria bacterium]